MEDKKEFNEITVLVDASLEELFKILEGNNFNKISEYDINDIYMLERNEDLSQNPLDILSNSLILRSIKEKDKTTNLILYKWKEYNEIDEIIKQSEVRCEVLNISDAEHILNIINWIKTFEIKDHIIVFVNDKTELAVQIVNDKDIYIEMENYSERTNKKYDSIEEMKEKFSSYGIPIKNNNFFAKKALNELNKYLDAKK